MVLISLKDKEFLHIYPQPENGNLAFQATFPEPGPYRGWLQFQTENIVETADFVFLIEQTDPPSKDESDEKKHTDQN